eukprot:Tamp_10386.p1 GENE.Tamp_10386~~Tamp_10386.p1  ORF type:complete len:681 (-),score=133.99 Tamp_10386:4-1974(-)
MRRHERQLAGCATSVRLPLVALLVGLLSADGGLGGGSIGVWALATPSRLAGARGQPAPCAAACCSDGAAGGWGDGAGLRLRQTVAMLRVRGGTGEEELQGGPAAREALRRGQECMANFDFTGAVAAFTSGIEAEPTVASLYTARAEAFSRLNRIEESLNDAVKVIALKDATAALEHQGAAPAPAAGAPPEVDGKDVGAPPARAKPQVPGKDLNRVPTAKAQKVTPKVIYPPEVIYPPAKGARANGSPGQPGVHSREVQTDQQEGVEEANADREKHAAKFLDSIQLMADVLSRYPFLVNDQAATSLTQCLKELASEAVMHSEARTDRLNKIPVLEEQVRVKEAEIRELSKRLADIEAIGNARDDESLLSGKITTALEEQVKAKDTQIRALMQRLSATEDKETDRGSNNTKITELEKLLADKDAEVSALTQRVAETSEIQQKVLEKEAEVNRLNARMIELQVEWRAKAQQPADADEETKDYLVNLEMGALSQRLRDLEEKLVRAREEKKQLALQKNGLTIFDLTPGDKGVVSVDNVCWLKEQMQRQVEELQAKVDAFNTENANLKSKLQEAYCGTSTTNNTPLAPTRNSKDAFTFPWRDKPEALADPPPIPADNSAKHGGVAGDMRPLGPWTFETRDLGPWIISNGPSRIVRAASGFF